jgi:hypothetical protein
MACPSCTVASPPLHPSSSTTTTTTIVIAIAIAIVWRCSKQ